MRKIISLLSLGLFGLVTGIVGVPSGYPLVSSLFPILFALPCFWWLIKEYTFQGIYVLLSLSVFALIIETIGLVTGIPYGHFSYGEMFDLTLFGITPIIVPFGWVPIVVGAYFATAFFKMLPKYHYFVFLLILLATDALVDPAAVGLSFWNYHPQGVYYAVPVSNYLGWILSGSVGYVLIRNALGYVKDQHMLYLFLLLLFYWTGVALGLGFVLPGSIGISLCFIMAKKLI